MRAGGDRSVSEERNPSLMREREMLDGCGRERERERGGGFCCCDVSRLLQHGAPEPKSRGHDTALQESGPAAVLGALLHAGGGGGASLPACAASKRSPGRRW